MRFARCAALATCCLSLAVLAPPGVTRAGDPPPSPGVRLTKDGGAAIAEVVLPGPLIAWAAPRRPGGSRELYALVAAAVRTETPPEAGTAGPEPCAPTEPGAPSPPTRLIRVGYTDGTLETVADSMPSDATGLLSGDLDGDGSDELLVVRPGEIDVVRPAGGDGAAGSLETLLRDPGLDPTRSPERGAAELAGGRLLPPAPRLGGVSFFGLVPGGDGLQRIADIPLPVSASRDDTALTLTSPLVVPVGSAPGGAPLFAASTRLQGSQRLGTLLIDPLAAPDDRSVERWSRLPAPERVLEAFCLLLDGRPALVVTTRPAHKLSFFGEKKLRLFFLDSPDRSRLGSDPALEVESRMNLWQNAVPSVADVDGDGRDDLVIGYWKGIKDDRVVLDAYLRDEDGAFRRSPRTTAFDVEDADRGVLGYGRDIDGDGAPDLILHAGGRLKLFRGDAGASGGKNLVEPEAAASWPWPGVDDGGRNWGDIDFDLGDEPAKAPRLRSPGAGFGPVRPVDLDGDGRPELVLGARGAQGTGRLTLVSPRR